MGTADGSQRWSGGPAAVLQQALDEVPFPFFIFDPVRDSVGRVVELIYSHINRAGLELYGRTASEVLGHGQLELFPSVVEQGIWGRYLGVLESGVSDLIDIPRFDENGVIGSFEVVAARVGDNLVVTAREVSDRNAMRAALRAADRSDPSRFDQLTGLAPRQSLLAALAAELAAPGRRTGAVAVVIIDVDDFRVVNESLGQGTGDDLLRGIAEVIAEGIPQAHAARFGDDEFAMMLCDLEQAAVIDWVRNLCQRLSGGLAVGARRLSAAVSAGVAISGSTSTADSMVATAEDAMHVARRRGGNQWVLSQGSASRDPRDTLVVEAALREALRADLLELHYQPVFGLANGDLVGVEALCRWPHQEWGMVPPAEFVAVAERRNLIGQLGDWVFTTAANQLRTWQLAHGPDAPLMAVNVSMRQLLDPTLRSRWAAQLATLGLVPGSMCLELTESQILSAGGMQVEAILGLHEVGLELAVDDFGAGYSGFGYLRRLPVRVLKIDCSFIAGIESEPTAAAIVAGMVTLGHSLGMRVVAEGIETAGQLRCVRELGVDAGQGWFWHAAMPAADIAGLIGAQGALPD